MAGAVRTFAAWAHDPEEARRLLAVQLDADRAWPVEPIRYLASTDHAVPDARTIFLAETRAIVLRNPNPFPPIRVFP